MKLFNRKVNTVVKPKTVAQLWKIGNFPFKLYDKNGNEIYYESTTGYWKKCECDSNNNIIYYENSSGFWFRREFDSNGNIIYYTDSSGFWEKCEYNLDGHQIYFEDSIGTIRDNRPKVELTLDEIANKFNIPVSQLKIKK